MLAQLTQRLGDLFAQRGVLRSRLSMRLFSQLLVHVVERLGEAQDFVGRLRDVLQRAGDAEPAAREGSFGGRLGTRCCIGRRILGRGSFRVVEIDAAEQVARVGHLGKDRLESLPQLELAAFQQRQAVAAPSPRRAQTAGWCRPAARSVRS